MIRLQWIRMLLIFIYIASSGVALGQTPGHAALEAKLHDKLSRILTADEYLLDIKVTPDGSISASNDKYLPGLQVLGALTEESGTGPLPIVLGGRADVLLILDKKVSKERAKVAQDLVNRIIDSEGLKQVVKVTPQQRDINKIPPPEPPPPPPPQDPPLLEQLIKEKDFISRALMVIWGAFVSLMAIYFILRRVLISNTGSAASAQGGRGSQDAPSIAPPQAAPGQPAKQEKTREELYSKDQAILESIQEVKNEAKEQPAKVARILARWVSQNDELTRAAALFLRNCEIKTVEEVCKSLHPSDLEKIIAHKIEDFEPFGTENQRTVERMRADLAVLASEHILKERPDPLKFLKMLSDDDIRNILEGENTETIAMVATQVPPHRMQKLFESSAPEVVSAVIVHLATIKAASAQDFDRLKSQLSEKAETLAGNLFTDKERVSSLTQIIGSIASPVQQCSMLDQLRSNNPQVYARVRPSLLVATDVRFLPGRVKSILIQSIDADTFGTALSDFAISFEAFLEGLPQTYQSVFTDAQNRRYDGALVLQAWRRISSTLAELTSSGLISKNDIVATIRRADQPTDESNREGSSAEDEFKERSGAA
jgi:flagellar motor switch protein FliG